MLTQRAAQCRSCHAPMVWGLTRNDVPMPLDAEPTAGGNALLHDDGRVDVLGPLELMLHEGGGLRMPHHATCPDREMWKRS